MSQFIRLLGKRLSDGHYFDIYGNMEDQHALRIFSALSQDTRLRIFRRLVQSGPEELPAGFLAGELQLAAATLSFHLKELSTAGLVNRRREGRHIFYSLNTECLQSFLAYLMQDCCAGRPELCEPLLGIDALRNPACESR